MSDATWVPCVGTAKIVEPRSEVERLRATIARLRDFARSHYRYGREVRDGRRFFTKTCPVCGSKWDIDSEQEPLGGGPAPHAADCPMVVD